MDINNISVCIVKAQSMYWNSSEMPWFIVKFVAMFYKIMSRIQNESMIRLQMVGGKRIESECMEKIINLVKVVKMMKGV